MQANDRLGNRRGEHPHFGIVDRGTTGERVPVSFDGLLSKSLPHGQRGTAMAAAQRRPRFGDDRATTTTAAVAHKPQ
jgi:hypothetical protein